jgi:hypothetical protein
MILKIGFAFENQSFEPQIWILGGVAFNQGFLAFSITVCGTAVASFTRLTPQAGVMERVIRSSPAKSPSVPRVDIGVSQTTRVVQRKKTSILKKRFRIEGIFRVF